MALQHQLTPDIGGIAPAVLAPGSNMSQQAAASLPSQANHAKSTLLSLPAELRNAIYNNVLQQDQTDNTIHLYANAKENPHIIKGQVSPLLHVCRQIRTEAEPMYWVQATLDGQIKDLTEAVPLLSDSAKEYIKTLYVEESNDWVEGEADTRRGAMWWARGDLNAVGFFSRRAILRMPAVRDDYFDEPGDDRCPVHDIEEPFLKSRDEWREWLK